MINKKFYSAFLLGLIVMGSAFGMEVKMDKAGYLSQMVNDGVEDTSLKVSGPVDASDLLFIGKEMTKLTNLDLSEAVIEAYKGENINGRLSYGAAEIPYGCFSGLPLETVVLPRQAGLIIGDVAFMGTNLSEVVLPSNVDSVGMGAFSACPVLTRVVVPAAKSGSAIFADCPSLVTADVSKVTEIAPYMFKGCVALTTVIGAENLETIGQCAFEGDTSLQDFTFGAGLKNIGTSAFAATGLKEVNLSNSTKLAEVPEEVFADASLENIDMPQNATEIKSGAFFGNAGLERIILPESLISIGSHALVGTGLTELDFNEGLEEIGDYALSGQDKIKTIVLPSTLLYIGDNGMEHMTGLEKINALSLETVPELGENVWEGVDQPNVILALHKEVANDFADAPQWQDFRFDIETDVKDDAIIGAEESPVKGRFVGTELQLVSRAKQIETVRLFDTSGRLLLTVEPRDMTAYIETSGFAGPVFVVNVTLDDKSTATLKMGRR